MTVQRPSSNPIQQRKTAVRTYSRNAVIAGALGMGGGIVTGLAFHSFGWFFVLLAVGLVVAGINVRKVMSIVNHVDT